MTTATLLVIAPCSLLVGAALQLLLARLLPARTKGVLAVLCCAPALLAVVSTIPLVMGGRSLDLRLSQWDGPLALILHVDALSVLFAFMATVHRRHGAALFRRLHGARQAAATRFYATMLVFIGGFVGTGVQRQPFHLLSLLGGRRPVLLRAGGLLVHQPRGGRAAHAKFC